MDGFEDHADLMGVNIRSSAGKRPRVLFPEQAESSEPEDSEEQIKPDLATYFKRFKTSAHDEICICRSYASYVSSTLRNGKRKN